MNNKKKLALLAAGLLSMSGAVAVNAGGSEKCYCVAKAGQNDCGSSDGRHGCAGQAAVDFDCTEWVMVEKDSCGEKGGTTKPGGPAPEKK